jgi:polyisoprenyl-phosphate glycosyltransferase
MLSLVIPVYNEESLIDELVGRSVASLESFTSDYEIIFVDDGSTDFSLPKLLISQQQNERIKVLSLSKNFGHQAAFTAGLEHAEGEIIAMMDGDLQDPPELLSHMVAKIQNEEYDIVSGKRNGRAGKRSLNFYTLIFHTVFKKFAGIQDMENAGNFSVMKRTALEALLSMKEKVRYLPGLRSFIGFKQGFFEYVRDERFSGNSKMNFSKLFMLGADAIFSFSLFPIRLCLLLGITGTIVFLGAGIYVLIEKIFALEANRCSSTLISIFFLGSIQLVFLGIIGEYVFRIYKESQNRPVYIVKQFYSKKLKK